MARILDWNKYEECARQAIGEGCVLLENNGVLPLKAATKIAVFGRIQTTYYKSGTGSGGKVNVAKIYSIVDGLEDAGLIINKNLQKIYNDWIAEHPYDEGTGWGMERWSQDEMPLYDTQVSSAASESDIAIVIIGRTAGEDKDNSADAGSFCLSADEKEMLSKVRKGFSKMIVLLNVGNIIDMQYFDTIKPDALMYVWQGGMLGGLGTADVLTGKINPSGKLTDTIAFDINDYPSTKWFGVPEGNTYCEDIYVGYRYFETFAKNKVRYPFGYGLSYSSFQLDWDTSCQKVSNNKIELNLSVKNTGTVEGKEVAQIYVQAPFGKLGKASRVLVDFAKTETLQSGKSQNIKFIIPFARFASYDDSGITGNPYCSVIEAGEYNVYAGTDVRSAKLITSFNVENLIVIEKNQQALAPVQSFNRMHGLISEDGTVSFVMEPVPLSKGDSKINLDDAKELQSAPDGSCYKLEDVLNKKISMEQFVAQFNDDDLSCIIRGEGMGSSLVTAGTASAFGGVSPRLREVFGLPVCCCDDGPSGMRLDCGIKAFALPNGTCLASTFNRSLVRQLYSFTGLEMRTNKVENLLGPGMNLHRNPLNGRNFEYFSEDPFVTGMIGTAVLEGLRSSGVTGTIKHFCGNNQEKNRYAHDSKVSERALRELYLKGFEMAVRGGEMIGGDKSLSSTKDASNSKEFLADSVMTTYGLVNNQYTAGCYDLNTVILRKEWGFTGIVMTDWWANITRESKTDFATMVRAQNDLYMCCPDGSRNASGDNTLQALKEGTLTRGELQRSAINVCNHIMQTQAMARLMNTDEKVEIINKPVYSDDINLDDIEFIKLGLDQTLDLTYQESKSNSNYILAFDMEKPGYYEVTLTANSNLNNLAQLSSTLFVTGIPLATFTFQGSEGKSVSITKEVLMMERFMVSRLFVASAGLNLENIHFKFIRNKD